jgi:hypothetical protein
MQIYLILFFVSLSSAYTHLWTLDTAGRHEIEIQLDAYYSAVDYIASLSNSSIPRISSEEESSYFGYLFTRFFQPRFVLLEASLNPLPIVGVALKKYTSDFYNDVQINPSLNLIKALTIGFPEPGALSLFFGNVVNLTQKQKVVGKAYSGFLMSYGNKHIVNNSLFADHWVELEMKVKGAAISDRVKSSWSFRIGSKQHFNQDISDIVYLALKYEKEDRDESPWSILSNSSFEYRMDLDQNKIPKISEHKDKTAVRYIAILGKKFPIMGGDYVISLDMGSIRQVGSGYSGQLANSVKSEWIWVVRPNLSF